MANEAVGASWAEDDVDIAALDTRKRERSVSFGSFVRVMKRRGLIWPHCQTFHEEGDRGGRYQGGSPADSGKHPGAGVGPAAKWIGDVRWFRRQVPHWTGQLSHCVLHGRGEYRHHLQDRASRGRVPMSRITNRSSVAAKDGVPTNWTGGRRAPFNRLRSDQ